MIVLGYASLLVLLFVGLSVRTILLRGKLRIGVGDGGNESMLRAMRAHANFAEYVPLALLMILMLELNSANAYLIHFLCFILLLGRCVHSYGVSQIEENLKLRIFGMSMTFTALGIAALLGIYSFFFA